MPALDGLRGCLALYVAFYHLADTSPYAFPMQKLAQLAVLIFFVLSGCVLTRGWDGRFGVFLVRRFVRLWPCFALALLAGCVVTGLAIKPSQLLWYPMASPYAGAETDRPAWSLFVEAWAMPAMPLFVWASRRAVRAVVVGVGLFLLGMVWRLEVLYGLFFLAGACLSGTNMRAAMLETPWAQWLGKVSYSLYLSHWLVVQGAGRVFGPCGRAGALFAILPVAWLMWRWVEAPSIVWSRAIGKRWGDSACPPRPPVTYARPPSRPRP